MSDPSSPPDGLLRMATAPLALPTGMRDLLPPRAARRRALGRTLLESFALFGYQLVVPPAFERGEVVSRGLGPRARADLVQFVEPETGDVVALRPDMTPQIARIAATRYRDIEGPLRLMYEGSVVRRPRGRARRQRQVAQAGIECIGWRELAADIEVIRAAGTALSAVGVDDWRVELGHASFAEEAMRAVPSGIRDLVTDALATRDTASLSRLLGATFGARSPLALMLELAGDATILQRAASQFAGTPFGPAIEELSATCAALDAAGLGDRVLIDLAEVRGLGYYTGGAFQFLSAHAGEPLGAGGRYDTLLARYGEDRCATGCALDVELVERAVDQGRETVSRTAIALGGPTALRQQFAAVLRARGTSVAEVPSTQPSEVLAYANALGYEAAWICTEDGPRPIDRTTGTPGAPTMEDRWPR